MKRIVSLVFFPYIQKPENMAFGILRGDVDDNFLIVQVDEDGMVNLELIALQGKKNRLGKLEDYTLPIK